jgi:hypothetical protein
MKYLAASFITLDTNAHNFFKYHKMHGTDGKSVKALNKKT